MKKIFGLLMLCLVMLIGCSKKGTPSKGILDIPEQFLEGCWVYDQGF